MTLQHIPFSSDWAREINETPALLAILNEGKRLPDEMTDAMKILCVTVLSGYRAGQGVE